MAYKRVPKTVKPDGTVKSGRQGDGGGRPPIQLDYDEIERLAMIQCTQEEIAASQGCSVDLLQKDEKFLGIYKYGQENGKKSLRRRQWQALDEGNTTMLVWLGKQYLRQSDKVAQEVSGPGGGALQVIIQRFGKEEA